MTMKKMTDNPETLTVTCETDTKEAVIKLTNIVKRNKKTSGRITPASLCRAGLEVLLDHAKEIGQIQYKDEADLIKQIKTFFR